MWVNLKIVFLILYDRVDKREEIEKYNFVYFFYFFGKVKGIFKYFLI